MERADLHRHKVQTEQIGDDAFVWLRYVALLLVLLLVAGCGNNGMEDQPKYEPYEASNFFENGTSAQAPVENTVARGQLNANTLLYAGQTEGTLATEFPFPVTSEVMARGQERYGIYCAPCHGYAGYGDGMIVQRGFSPPPSFHEQRLRDVPVGYFFQVITDGIGVMYSYGDRVQPADRWAIIAYIRALQLSQNATMAAVTAEIQPTLEASTEEMRGTEGVTVTDTVTDTEGATIIESMESATSTESVTTTEVVTE